MITLVNIIIYFIACFCAAVFGRCDTKTEEDKGHALFWAGAFCVFFILAVVIHVFN